jgi:hypothetical protein
MGGRGIGWMLSIVGSGNRVTAVLGGTTGSAGGGGGGSGKPGGAGDLLKISIVILMSLPGGTSRRVEAGAGGETTGASAPGDVGGFAGSAGFSGSMRGGSPSGNGSRGRGGLAQATEQSPAPTIDAASNRGIQVRVLMAGEAPVRRVIASLPV